MNVREASEADLPRLLELYEQLATSAPHVNAARLRDAFIRLPRDVARVLLFEEDERVVGTLILIIVPVLGDRCRSIAIVEDVVVDDAVRGRGIGRRMMEHAMSEARAAGCYKLMLSSNLRREEAHRFYESLGFEKHGHSFLVEL